MAAKPKKTVSRKATGAKAGAAAAERPKDAGKASFGKAAPKTVKPATSAKPAKAKAAAPSMATRVMRKVKATASGAVELAASVVGKGSKKAKAK